MSREETFYGSAISALQECKRSWILERIPYVNYYFGEYYNNMSRYGKAYTYYIKSIRELKEYDRDKSDFIDDYLSEQHKFIEM